uniref:ARAD1D13068p n=1 Tax=Blastobotrys adeninivorans TaxID=409370 RepID=A0A060TE64_BLAAD
MASLRAALASSQTPPELQAVEYIVDQPSLDTKNIQSALETLKDHAQTVPDQNDQVARLAAIASSHLYERLVDSILYKRAIPRTRDVEYWDSVLYAGPIGLATFAVQSAPRWLWATAFSTTSLSAPTAVLFTNLYAAVTAPLSPAFAKSSWRNWRNWRNPTGLIAAPLNVVRSHVRKNRKHALKKKHQAAEQLGTLVLNFPSKTAATDPTQALFSSLAVLKSVLKSSDIQADASVPADIVEAIDQLIELSRSKLETDPHEDLYRVPSVLIRYWPLLGVAVMGGYKVLGNWRAIIMWTKDHIVDTTVSLWKNWILSPLYKVYQTIRHDEDAQLSIMGRQSLQSDMSSLERMVVDYVSQNSSLDDASVEQIRSAVSQGDLSMVLEQYEKQLETPIKSIVTGKLIRSLLIQVQKTKVDVEVAMDGYDRLMKSQQLVVVLIAALPALGLLWWGYNATFSGRRDAARLRLMSNYKDEIKYGLGNLGMTIRSAEEHSHGPQGPLSPLYVGLLLCQTVNLRRQGPYVFSKRRLQQWLAQLKRIDNSRDIASVEQALRDIWLEFGPDLK